jgi:hypothetical protein
MLTDAGLRTQPTQIDALMTSKTSNRLQTGAIRSARGLRRNRRARGVLPNPQALARPPRPGDAPGCLRFVVLRRGTAPNDALHWKPARDIKNSPT